MSLYYGRTLSGQQGAALFNDRVYNNLWFLAMACQVMGRARTSPGGPQLFWAALICLTSILLYVLSQHVLAKNIYPMLLTKDLQHLSALHLFTNGL